MRHAIKYFTREIYRGVFFSTKIYIQLCYVKKIKYLQPFEFVICENLQRPLSYKIYKQLCSDDQLIKKKFAATN